MEKLKYIRKVCFPEGGEMLIFKAIRSFSLSDIRFEFNELWTRYLIRLPNLKIGEGDFIWITNMKDEDLEGIISCKNTSRTNTIVLQFDDIQSIKELNSCENVEESVLVL
ncbi:hypothetical protein D7V92_17940 [Parabacteroides sp. CH2-D42-20]|uniref:hypothetical protein n=1 Tax=unclassified Parabacteroides TaxID=2649774 RepID=UPI000EF70676|nr:MULTISPECIES: hypothetical protein [unclassified Parabacteroides]MDO5430565.1 hypothetical protein [Parabacteroides sp.]RLT68214.1 hypothetical protein D7V92_17940 [Parabacteroides sp. CH2-D42-20]